MTSQRHNHRWFSH